MSHYQAAREEKFRGGVRLLLAASTVPITGLAVVAAVVGAAPAWLGRPVSGPVRSVLLYLLAGLTALAAVLWIAALLRRVSWRGTGYVVWAGSMLTTVVVLIIPEAGRGASGSGVCVLAAAVVLVALIGWTFVRFDSPAT